MGGRGSSGGKRSGGGGRPEGDGSYGQDQNGHKYTKEEYESRLKALNEYDEYHYHATTEGAFNSIRDDGLKPNRGHLGEEVYMAKTAEDALDWTAGTSTGGEIVTRVSNAYLAKTDYIDYDRTKGGEGSTSMRIPVSQVQVRTHSGSWVNIQDAALFRSGGRTFVIRRRRK